MPAQSAIGEILNRSTLARGQSRLRMQTL